jgi:hypothetical protein
VYLEIAQPLSSETAMVGESVLLRVAFDVRSRGFVVIKRGAPASGSVEEAVSTGIVGKAGLLVLRPQRCNAVDGSAVLLEGEHRIQGAEYFEESAAVAGMVCCLGIFLKGKKAEVEEKTIVSSFVVNGVSVDVTKADQSEQVG